MKLLYTLFLLTFLVYPVLGFTLSRLMRFTDQTTKLLKLLLLLFLIHHALYFFGVSIKGDYPDYFIFSAEYLFICLMIRPLLRIKNNYLIIIKIVGVGIITIGCVVGFLGILLFPVIAQDFETDQIFLLKAKDKSYETRRYAFGTVGSIDTRYTFETYRTFTYFPVEVKIDETDFSEQKSPLYINEANFQINIGQSGNKQQIIFRSSNGHAFIKNLD